MKVVGTVLGANYYRIFACMRPLVHVHFFFLLPIIGIQQAYAVMIIRMR